MSLRSFLAMTLLTGCALTGKGDVLNIRWFDPEQPRARLTSAGPHGVGTREAPVASGLALELGAVRSSGNLREKIVYRSSPLEVGYYEEKRWTERPEVYVRRALERTLFEERGIKRVLAGQAPTLDVELVAFEEIRQPHGARIQLRFLVHDGRDSLLERTITIDRPAASGDLGFVRAMSEALDAAAEEVTRETASVLASRQESSSK